jgi:hypothetical protein
MLSELLGAQRALGTFAVGLVVVGTAALLFGRRLRTLQ